MNTDALTADGYLQAQTSVASRAARLLWNVVCLLLFRPSPRPLHAWRALLLRCFGARLGRHCRIYPRAKIWAPWNLDCGDIVAIADDVIIYNAAPVTLGSHAIVSQQALLCTAEHAIDQRDFPMTTAPIVVGAYAWVCMRAAVLPGVTIGRGAVLALGAVATGDLLPWTVYAGIPARRLRERKCHD